MEDKHFPEIPFSELAAREREEMDKRKAQAGDVDAILAKYKPILDRMDTERKLELDRNSEFPNWKPGDRILKFSYIKLT